MVGGRERGRGWKEWKRRGERNIFIGRVIGAVTTTLMNGEQNIQVYTAQSRW